MDITTILLTAMLALNSARAQGNPEAHENRLQKVTDDIVYVSTNRPVFSGEAGPEATAIALYAIAHHESGFWEKVQDCSICYPGSSWCDHGRSVTLFQLREGSFSWGEYTREELCSDNRAAAERALAVLWMYRRSSTPREMFHRYARGTITDDGIGTEFAKIFDDMCRKAKIRVLTGGKRMHASRIPD